MGEAGGRSRGFPDGNRNHQHGDGGFCTFICSARPLRNGFVCSLFCFAAGLGLISYGIVSYILQINLLIAWQVLIYIAIGAMLILTGVVTLVRFCCLYRSFRRHQEQTAQNFAFHVNLGPQEPQVRMTGQRSAPYQSYGPGQDQPPTGYPTTVGPQYTTGTYPRQQPYPQARGAVPPQQRTPPVQTGLYGTPQTGYPPTAHAQETEPSAPPPYDEVVYK